MKKLILLLTSFVSIFNYLVCPAACMDVLKHDEHTVHGPRHVELPSTVDEHSHVLKIAASDLNISDDFIVQAIKYSAPISVSEALAEILYISDKYEKVDIDLSTNTICDQGAGIIGTKLCQMKSLTSVDLSWNRITDGGINTLVTLLKPVLLRPEFVTLSITGNYGANRANLRKIISSFEQAEQAEQAVIKSKIKFE